MSTVIALVTAVAVLLGCISWLLLRNVRLRRQGLAVLRLAKGDLEAQVDARAR